MRGATFIHPRDRVASVNGDIERLVVLANDRDHVPVRAGWRRCNQQNKPNQRDEDSVHVATVTAVAERCVIRARKVPGRPVPLASLASYDAQS